MGTAACRVRYRCGVPGAGAGCGVVMAWILDGRPGPAPVPGPRTTSHGIPGRAGPGGTVPVAVHCADARPHRSRWTAHGRGRRRSTCSWPSSCGGACGAATRPSTSTCGCGDTSTPHLVHGVAGLRAAPRRRPVLLHPGPPPLRHQPAGQHQLPGHQRAPGPADLAVRSGGLAQRGRHPGPGGPRPVGQGAAAAVDDLGARRVPGRSVLRLLALRASRTSPSSTSSSPPSWCPRSSSCASTSCWCANAVGPGRGAWPSAGFAPCSSSSAGATGRLRPGRRERHRAAGGWPALVRDRGRPSPRGGATPRQASAPPRPSGAVLLAYPAWYAVAGPRALPATGSGPTSSSSPAPGGPCSSRPTPRPRAQRRARDLRVLRQPSPAARLPRPRHGRRPGRRAGLVPPGRPAVVLRRPAGGARGPVARGAGSGRGASSTTCPWWRTSSPTGSPASPTCSPR